MSREILLVRHGEAHCNVAGVIAGETCEGLTATGRHQVRSLAMRLLAEANAGRPISALYTSPVRRARETALAVAALTGTDLVIRPDLRVPDPGPADGLPWDDVRQRWPPDPDRPSRPLIDGGEAWPHYLDRAHACLSSIVKSGPNGRIVIVGHSETVTAAFTLLAGVRSLGALKVDLEPTGITRLTMAHELPNVQLTNTRWELAIHNDTAHLEETDD